MLFFKSSICLANRLPRLETKSDVQKSSPLTASATQAVFFSFLCKQGLCIKQTTSISTNCWRHWWESDSGKSLVVITLAQTSPWRPRVMNVDNDDPTKHWTSNGSSSQSPPDRHYEDDGKPQQLSPLPYLHDQLRKLLLSNTYERRAYTFQDEPRFSTRSSSKTAKRICFHDLSCYFFKFLFDRNVHRDGTPFFCARTAHDHHAAPDWPSTLSDSAAGRGRGRAPSRSRSRRRSSSIWLDRTGPVILWRAPACKVAYSVVRLTNFIRPGNLLSDR